MDQSKVLSKNEKRVIKVCLIGMLLLLLVLILGERFGLFSRRQIVGITQNVINDVRHLSDESTAWYPTQNKDKVYLGDSILTKENSKVQVIFPNDSRMEIHENSLVVFRKVENEDMPNLLEGNLHLKIDNIFKIALNGRVTTLKGQNSEVQIYLDADKKPHFKLLKGQALFAYKDQKFVNLDYSSTLPQTPAPVELALLKDTRKITYNWKLYDLYERYGFELQQRKTPPQTVNINTELSWSQSKPTTALLELADNSAFVDKKTFNALGGSKNIEEAALGDNYWRVSLDQGKNWSLPLKFVVEGDFLKNAEPILETPHEEVVLLTESASVALDIRSPVETLGYVAEASLTPDFKPETTKTFWSPDTHPRLSFFHGGRYFYRFRTVSANQELSIWSSVKIYDVIVPERPQTPVLAKINKRDLLPKETLRLVWNTNGVDTITEITNTRAQKVTTLHGDKIHWSSPAPGTFLVRSYALNKYGQASSWSKSEIIIVAPRKPVAPPLNNTLAKIEKPAAPQPAPEPTRKPTAAEATSALRVDDLKEVKPINIKYKNTQLSVQGFLWTLQSSQQYYNSVAAPIVSGLGVHGMHWWEDWGFEGSIKSGVMSLNQSGQTTALRDFEGRLHYRFITGFPFGLARELQTSLFVGYEKYQNTGGMFSSGYDLVKFGTSLEFPLWSRWSTGGELILGQGPDSSAKQEIGGNLTYFFDRDWSMGFGYRINLFTAGSAAAAPQGSLPYKEGSSEVYSILNYHF